MSPSPVQLPPSRAQAGAFIIGRYKGKIGVIVLQSDDCVLFFDSAPIAVETGKTVYFHIPEPSSAQTKAVNALSPESPHVRLDGPGFDFVLGSVLTKVGLGLTRREG